MHTPHTRAPRIRLAGLLVAATLAVAACGSDDDSADTSSTDDSAAPAATDAPADTDAPSDSAAPAGTTSDTAAGSGDLAAIQAEVDVLIAGDFDLPQPSEPVDPGTHEVAVIAAGMASTGPATVVAAIEDALALAGWTVPSIGDGKFVPTEQAALISQAVADQAEAIFLVAITPSAVSAAVAEAQQAGIPILCVLCGPDPITDGITNIESDPNAAGAAQANYVIANSNGEEVNVVVYQNQEFEFSEQQGIESIRILEEQCPNCTVETRSLLLAEAREPNSPIYTSLLQDYAEGELDWVIMPFDGAGASGLATTGDQLGRDDFGIVGYGALAPFVDMIGTGEPTTARASVTIPTPYFGWSAVDLAARILADAETWDAGKMDVGLITTDNFDTYPVGMPYVYPDFEFEEFFGELWGK